MGLRAAVALPVAHPSIVHAPQNERKAPFPGPSSEPTRGLEPRTPSLRDNDE